MVVVAIRGRTVIEFDAHLLCLPGEMRLIRGSRWFIASDTFSTLCGSRWLPWWIDMLGALSRASRNDGALIWSNRGLADDEFLVVSLRLQIES